jgi:hypothetical protein
MEEHERRGCFALVKVVNRRVREKASMESRIEGSLMNVAHDPAERGEDVKSQGKWKNRQRAKVMVSVLRGGVSFLGSALRGWLLSTTRRGRKGRPDGVAKQFPWRNATQGLRKVKLLPVTYCQGFRPRE